MRDGCSQSGLIPRVFAKIAAGVIAGLLCASGGVKAQSLQRLHVQAFTLSTDTPAPELEVPFHLTIHARVAEPVSELRNVELPVFQGLESFGDQRTLNAGPKGTSYDEVLTVVAHQSGAIDVSPAYLDAIDARDGKPKRFISNTLRLNVRRGALSPVNALATFFAVVLRLAVGLVLVIAAVFVVVAVFRRRPVAPEPLREPAVAVTVVPPDPSRDVREALEALRHARDRVHVMRLREALWRRSGVSPGGTLSDFLSAEPNVTRRSAARAVEVAAFVEERTLQPCIDEAIRATEGAL